MRIFESKTPFKVGDLVLDILTKEKGLVIELLYLKDHQEAYYKVLLQNPYIRRYLICTYSKEALTLLSSAC